jgi:hypothetical protein
MTPWMVLQSVVERGLSGPTQAAFVSMWGTGAGPSFLTLHPRSGSVSLAAVRAAKRAMVLTPPGASVPTTDLNAAIDAWIAGMVQVATMAVPRPPGWADKLKALRLGAEVSPASIGNEVGALCEQLKRAFPEWEFPFTAAARRASGCGDGPDRSTKDPCFPGAVHDFLDSPAGARIQPMCRAALALGAGFGLPIGLTASLLLSEVDIVADVVARRSAIVLGIVQRETGRKVHARRAVVGTRSATWTASAFASLARHFVPWLRERMQADGKYVFPRPTTAAGVAALDDSDHVGHRLLEDTVKLVMPTATWHSLRLGVEQAVDMVHLVAGGPPSPVAGDVRNVLTLRSNKELRGSRNVYVRDRLDPLLVATRFLHKAIPMLVGGLASHSSSQAARLRVGPPAFDTSCTQCRKHLPSDVGGSLCDQEGCLWTLCLTCWPDPAVELWCPAHSP